MSDRRRKVSQAKPRAPRTIMDALGQLKELGMGVVNLTLLSTEQYAEVHRLYHIWKTTPKPDPKVD